MNDLIKFICFLKYNFFVFLLNSIIKKHYKGII